MVKTAEIRVRDIIAIDGEGRDIADEHHIYGLLLAYSSHSDITISIDDWDTGLSTSRCLDFLLYLRHGRNTICCSFFFNYDVTMWVKDLSIDEKSALWHSGWTVYSANGRHYYIRYIPNKIFFVGSCGLDLVRNLAQGEPAPSVYQWPDDYRCILVYDVGSFSQKSFVKTLTEWNISVPDEIVEMKKLRGSFTKEMKDRIEAYCEQEMIGLATYVQKLDETFQSEGIKLPGWYGPGAIASYLMRKYKMSDVLADPQENEIQHAIMSAYFGGRNELFRMGHIRKVHNYDINSAYPSAVRRVPNLATGTWSRASHYNQWERSALWHVEWDVSHTPLSYVGPFPFRRNREVLYPTIGEGWYHAEEVLAAKILYGDLSIHVLDGYIYTPKDSSPFYWVNPMAARRIELKQQDDPRALIYKLGLNSIYGKLAQHTSEEGRIPPFQCYFAAGMVTAITRAHLLIFMAYEARLNDLVMVATDGVFCLAPRQWNTGKELGQFDDNGIMDDCYIVQPGVYYTKGGKRRTRGFGVTALTYQDIAKEWHARRTEGVVRFTEDRFIGLGSCVGTGDFSHYGAWMRYDGRDADHPKRILSLGPSKKFPGEWEGEALTLVPYQCPGSCSEPYAPRRMNDPAWAQDVLDDVLESIAMMEQPDLTDAE